MQVLPIEFNGNKRIDVNSVTAAFILTIQILP